MNCRWRYATGVTLLALSGCAARPDVDIAGPALQLDSTRPIMPLLVSELPLNKSANTFRLSWSIMPDPQRPLESLPHFLVYDRKAKTLVIHRDQPLYEHFSGVTDAILHKLVAEEGAISDLTKAGCSRQMFPEK